MALSEAQSFSMWFFDQIPVFLWSEPIRYIVSLVLLVLVIKIVLKIISIGKI